MRYKEETDYCGLWFEGLIHDLMDLCIYIDCKEGWGCMGEEENSHNGKQKTNLTGNRKEYISKYTFSKSTIERWHDKS